MNDQVNQLFKQLEQRGDLAPKTKAFKVLKNSIILFNLHCAARNWFEEQAENPDLLIKRGGRANQPLPAELGLFDSSGIPLEQQSRQNWVKLQQWVDDENNILSFVFPDELTTMAKEEKQLLLDDLAHLKQQDWSLQKMIATVLDDWPEDQAVKDFSTQRYIDDLIQQCERVLAEAGHDKKESNK